MTCVLVCGGRYYANKEKVFHVLTSLHRQRPITQLIQGGATGADALAPAWAAANGVPCPDTFTVSPYDWRRLGRRAGPLRNRRMLDEGRPDFAVAFRGGNGTLDMVTRLMAANVSLIDEDTRYPLETRRVRK